MAIINVTNDTFQKEVIEDKGVVFVDFFAEWCGPCKFTTPIIEELSEDASYKDKVKFVAIDVDQNQELSAQYNVFSIPTFIIFKNGAPVGQMVGARDRGGFATEIDKALTAS